MKRFLMAVVLCGLLSWGPAAVWADSKEPDTRELTIEEAVDMAIKNSASIKNSKLAIDAAYETRQKTAANSLGSIHDISSNDISAMTYLAALQQADLSWQMTRKNNNLLEDSVEYATHQAYNNILQVQAKIELCEKEIKNAELQRTVAQARNRVGMSNQLALDQAEAAVVSAKSSYEEAIKSLENAYLNFNYLVGLWPEDRPVLTETPSIEKLEVIDISNYIERKLAESPSLWQKNKSVDLAQAALDSYVPNSGSSDTYLVKSIAVDQSKLEADDAKEQARKSLRELYNSIIQMEEQYPVLEESIRVATESLRVTQLNYEVGMATWADVVSAETALAQTEKNLVDVICQHDVQKLAFSKPWAYGL